MARATARQRALSRLRKINAKRHKQAAIRLLFDDRDAFEDDLDAFYRSEEARVASTRYVERPATYRRREDRWKRLLHDPEFLNDSEFLLHFRVTRSAFWKLHALIRDDPIYQPAPHRTFRGGADLHLMVLLKYLGMCGNGNSASSLALFFRLGKGSIGNYVHRATTAILKLQDEVVTWPDAEERRAMSKRIHEQYGFPNCVGIVDGTLLPLATKPEHKSEAYYTRKGGYAINALVTCDDLARVRDIVVGWPGSVHDNRVWSNGRLNQQSDKFFRSNEYVLGDSAFTASQIVVPAFKKPPRAELDPHRTYFNTRLAKLRIKSEHCLGLIKARFHYLKGIRSRLKTAAHMKKILRFVMCAVILHNLLISEPIPREWETEMEAASALDEDDELNSAVPENAKGDERRSQLLAYLLELRR